MPSAHAKLSPSAADRWMQCPGSIALCESLGLTSSPPSRFSAEGTFAHSIRAKCLETKCDPREFIGVTETVDGFEFTCDGAMADHLRPGIDSLRHIGGDLHVEVKLDLDKWIPGGFGTSDAVVITGNTLIVDDLKFGSGVPVSAKDNRQLMIYALGALALHPKAKTIVLNIDQPRTGDGTGSSATVTRAQLLAFGKTVKAAALAATSPGAPLVPGEKTCKWCPAKGACSALAAYTAREMGMTGDSEGRTHIPEVQSLTPQQRANILTAKPLIESWLEAVHAASLADALAGQPDPGWKVVEGRRGNRAWVAGAERILVGMLGDAAFEKKLISPAAADKLAPKDFIAPLVTQPDGKPALVAVDDKRPSIGVVITAASMEAPAPTPVGISFFD